MKRLWIPRPLHWLRRIRAGRTARKTNEQLLEELRYLLAVKGKLSNKIIDESVGCRLLALFATDLEAHVAPSKLIGYNWWNNGRKSDEEMLQHLRSLLASHGRLSMPIIDAEPRLISSHKLRRRFGRVGRAYELIGYDWKKDLSKARGKT